jgi:Rrf2 family protein
MAANTQFSIAVHLLAGLGFECGQNRTSAQLAASINTSPSFVRRVLAKLSKAGLVETAKGKGGCCKLRQGPEKISLLDVYQAVGAPGAITLHHYEIQKACVVSCNIKAAMDKILRKPQKALEDSLAKITLAEVIAAVKKS